MQIGLGWNADWLEVKKCGNPRITNSFLSCCNVAYARARVSKVRYTKEMLASQAIRTTYSSQATTKKRRSEIFYNS